MSRSITCWSITAPCSWCSTRSASTSCVTENMFGDILSDEGAVLAGSIGMLPSASIGDEEAVRRMDRALRAGARLRAGYRGTEQSQSARRHRLGRGHAGIQLRPEGRSRRGERAPWKQVLEQRPGNRGSATVRHAGHHGTSRRSRLSGNLSGLTDRLICQDNMTTLSKNSGTPTSSTKSRARPRCSISICTWCMKSRRRRPSQGLRERGLKVRRPDLTIATADHSIPTTDRSLPIVDPIAAKQVDAARNQLRANSASPASASTVEPSGHRARHRAGAGPHAARHDRRLRR